MRLCKTPGCKRNSYVSAAAPKPGKVRTVSTYCNPCRSAREKATDLAAWAFRKLRGNAKRRGIFFDLTLPQFREFCYATDILNGRGIGAQSWHVDKIVDALGYTAGNLQKLTNSENSKKDARRRKLIAYVAHFDENGYTGGLRMIDVTIPECDDCGF